MQYLKCYKNVFSKKLFENNIGNIFIFLFIIFQILSLLYFFLISKNDILANFHENLIKKSKNGFQEEKNENEEKENDINLKGSKNNSTNKKNSENISISNKSKSTRGSKIGNKNEGKDSIKGKSSEKNKSKKSSIISDSNSGSKSIGSNPPKKEKNKYKNIFGDSEEESKKNKIENKDAPKSAFEKYAKRFLRNRKDYVDDSYREDSYDFDLSKLPKEKKKIECFDDDGENTDNNDKNKENAENNIKEKGKEENKNGEIEENKNGENENKKIEKKENNSKKNLAKLEKEKLKEEIQKFKKLGFCELYWFILKKRHRIISLFIKKDVYDIISIKFSLLILSYTIDFFITTFLFFDFEIRFLFRKKKHIDPYYTIIMGIIDILISTILMRIVDFLLEFRTKFKNIEKNEKNEKNKNYYNLFNENIKALIRKIIIYYIINFAFSLIVWYIVTSFIGTYLYIKLNWGIMIGMNFGLSNIFPFLYYLIVVAFQYKGIHSKKYKLYKFAMIMSKI